MSLFGPASTGLSATYNLEHGIDYVNSNGDYFTTAREAVEAEGRQPSVISAGGTSGGGGGRRRRRVPYFSTSADSEESDVEEETEAKTSEQKQLLQKELEKNQEAHQQLLDSIKMSQEHQEVINKVAQRIVSDLLGPTQFKEQPPAKVQPVEPQSSSNSI